MPCGHNQPAFSSALEQFCHDPRIVLFETAMPDDLGKARHCGRVTRL